MRFIALALILSAPLAGCVTTGTVSTVTLPAEKAFLTAQTSFAAMQITAIASIKAGVLTGPLKAKVIDLLHTGAGYEAAGYAGDVIAIRNLTDIVAQLSALGIKGN